MQPVNTTEPHMTTPSTQPAAPRVSRYHLTPESRALIASHGANLRAQLAVRRAQRQALDTLAFIKRGRA